MKLFGGNGGKRADNHIKHVASEKTKKRGNAGKVILIVLLVIAIIAAGVVIYWKVTTKPPVAAVTPPVGEEPDGDEAPNTGTRYFTTLIVGKDQLDVATDTIMLMQYDSYERKADILSIPRDTLVNVPWSGKRINNVFYAGENGIESLMDEVGRLTGTRPDKYVLVNMQVFMDVVEAMGGVWFDVPRNMNYDDYALDNFGNPYEFTIHVDKGYQLLKPYDAIGVFRFRQNNDGTGYEGGDWDRIEVQHDLMFAIAKQAMATRNLATLMDIAKSVFGNCETDFILGNIQWYLREFLRMSMDDITFYTLPTDGCWIYANAYVTVNADAWVQMLNEHFNLTGTEIKAEDLPLFQAKNYEIDRHTLTPSNYYMTNGDEPYTNFPKGYDAY